MNERFGSADHMTCQSDVFRQPFRSHSAVDICCSSRDEGKVTFFTLMLYVGEKFHVVCEFKIIIIAAKKNPFCHVRSCGISYSVLKSSLASTKMIRLPRDRLSFLI